MGIERTWSDTVGVLFFCLTVAAVFAHGIVRVRTLRRSGRERAVGSTQRTYLYNAYERIWHWVMAFSLLLLVVSGLGVHFPGGPAALGLDRAVYVHNFMAAVLIGNAFLALFYHLSTNEIMQFLPEGAGAWGRVKAWLRYYLHGIFRGATHPTGRSRAGKLNVLQQFAYAGLLNILLPMQVITGSLLWATGQWPELTRAMGGVAALAPRHNLGSWLFVSFLVAHVYLTTTGRTALHHLRSMASGWEDVEIPAENPVQGGAA